MIGILDFIYFPFLGKYIKKYIHSFIEFKHHLLHEVHESLIRFYSYSYIDLISTDNTKKLYQISYSRIMEWNLKYIKSVEDHNIIKVKELKRLLSSYLMYNKHHPLHHYLIRLWVSGCLVKYKDPIIDSTINTLNIIHSEEYNKFAFRQILGCCAYSN